MIFTKVLKERVLEVAHFAKTSVGFPKMTWPHIPEVRTVDSHGAGNLNSSVQVNIAQRTCHV